MEQESNYKILIIIYILCQLFLKFVVFLSYIILYLILKYLPLNQFEVKDVQRHYYKYTINY